MTNDDRGGGVKNAENLMTSYVNDPYEGLTVPTISAADFFTHSKLL